MPASDNDSIRRSTELIDSLVSCIPKLSSFKSKWSLIRTKLIDLRTQVADFSEFGGLFSNKLALELLQSVWETLECAVSIAARCEGSDLVEGKLKTQSEVDSVMARLDRHVKDAEVLIKSGVLLDDVDIVSGCSISSNKEATRVEARNLVTRLQIGGLVSKNSAMDSLLELLQRDDKNVVISVAQGVVPVLVRLLDSSSAVMKEKTVAAISRISLVNSSKHALIAEGLFLLNHLLRVLESGSGFGKEKACIALEALSTSKENARAIGLRGGITSLLEICQGGTPGSQALAAGILKNLASFPETKENFIEENAIVVLFSLISSGTPLAQENAVACLANLTSEDENLRILVVKEGGIECLKSYWDSTCCSKSLEVAVCLLRNLASCQPIREVLVSEGFIPRVVSALSSGIMGVRVAAAAAVSALGFNSKTRKEMGECGCIAPLIHMLEGKSVQEKEAASMALSTLLVCKNNRRVFKKSEKGVYNLVQLLDPKLKNLDKRYPMSAVESLVGSSKKSRKQMVAAGACLHLQKLVEMNVDGSKKLSDSLSRSKMWGVFARP